ncbi:MAG: RAMP superfamily CRISPR-associated protein [Gordonia sp. (in: high G+C Gram-positive bacteria)]
MQIPDADRITRREAPERSDARFFLNPYHFVSAPPRGGRPALGDHAPASHGVAEPGMYAARVPIVLTTRTPLLVPDQPRGYSKGKGPRVLRTRVDRAGQAVLSGSTVKGMLRAAYEAITNSRYGVFDPRHAEIGSIRVDRTRRYFTHSPKELTPLSLLPATQWDGLSPADRVFGWVLDRDTSDAVSNTRGRREKTAVKGHLRVTAPQVLDAPDGQSVQELVDSGESKPLGLSILNTPKPTQYRFYTLDGTGNPISRAPKSELGGFRRGDQLRGRKFYLPHADVFDDNRGSRSYWMSRDPFHPVKVNGRQRYPEHVTVVDDKPEVSIAVKNWVPAGTTFGAELFIDNVSVSELGALLWLLALPEQSVFTMGLGKPLGFGAVRVDADWDHVQISTPDEIRQRYRSLAAAARQLSTGAGGNKEIAQKSISHFDQMLRQDEQLKTVRAEFLDATMGYSGLPVHYPRVFGENNSTEPRPNTYEWWMKNEKKDKRALPRMLPSKIPWLPYLHRR